MGVEIFGARHARPLDGPRGFGILASMIHHSFPLNTYGFVGVVDVSSSSGGFLITSLMLQEHRGHGGIHLKKFQARRALRLLPLLYVVLLSTAVVGVPRSQPGLPDTGRSLACASLGAVGGGAVLSDRRHVVRNRKCQDERAVV